MKMGGAYDNKWALMSSFLADEAAEPLPFAAFVAFAFEGLEDVLADVLQGVLEGVLEGVLTGVSTGLFQTFIWSRTSPRWFLGNETRQQSSVWQVPVLVKNRPA